MYMTAPNLIMQGQGFYISYNPVDVSTYGDVTTALVLDDMSKFYVLNGNHRDAYRGLIDSGFDACLAYFVANPGLHNKYSDKV